MPAKEKVLFLCTGNSCRSQMAEGLLRALAGDQFEAYSAGTQPKAVHPGAVRAMAELGIDIGTQRSESVDLYLSRDIDQVITVCDRAASDCPTFPGRARKTHWSFDDPAQAVGSAEERMGVFRRVRDEIAETLRDWLGPQAASGTPPQT